MPKLLPSRFAFAALMGFSSGLPLLLTRSTLRTWLVDGGVDIKAVGFFALVTLPYAFKFVWAPAVDRWELFGLGRRRGWILASQAGLALGLLALALIEPSPSTLALTAAAALWTAVFGATQDVALDAYRRESFPDLELGLASSVFVTGYRVALLAAGGGALYLADVLGWRESYLCMAGLVGCGTAISLIAPEPPATAPPPRTLKESVVGPLAEFFKRDGAILILLFVLLYKIGEQMASDMFNPFFRIVGFSKTEIAAVAKVYGFWATILGGFAGGWALKRLGAIQALFVFGCLQSLALLLFSGLASAGPNTIYLAVAVGCENFASGMATAAYLAFMATQTNRRFTATQYALLSSLLGAAGAIAGSATGVLADALGWRGFFVACVACTVPGLALLLPLRRLAKNPARAPT